MQQESRLRKTADFAAVWSEGRSKVDRLFVVRVRPNGLGVTRIGFSVSKRIGNAVARNLVKRRLREVTRATAVEAGFDIVIAARNGPPMSNSGESNVQFAICSGGPAYFCKRRTVCG